MKKIFTLLTTLCFASTVSALDPWLNWQTLETEHFNIHYVQDRSYVQDASYVKDNATDRSARTQAEQISALAEHYYRKLSQEFEWQPDRSIHIVLNDFVDESNGSATPLPYPTVNLYLVPPADGELQDVSGWLELLIHHELVHVFHLDKAKGLPKNARRFLGRNPLLFPNIFTPNWLTEGLATYYETDVDKGVGRGQSDFFKMMMREEVRTGLKPLRQVSVPSVEWPLNQSYLYGVYFLEYLSQRFGENAIQRWIDGYSENIIPYLFVNETEFAFGVPLDQLWLDFEAYLQQQFNYTSDEKSVEARSSFEKFQLTRLSKHPFRHSAPIYSVTGDIYYLKDDGKTTQSVIRASFDKSAGRYIETLVFDTIEAVQLEEAADGSLWYRRLQVCEEYGLYYDLYRYHKGKITRETECARIQHFKWINQHEMLRLRYLRGIPMIDLYNVQTKRSQSLWQGIPGDIVGAFDWEPLTGRLVASIRPNNIHAWNLALLDLSPVLNNHNDAFVQTQQLQWQPLTFTADIKQTPKWIDQGQTILFTQAAEGYFDLMLLDLRTQQLTPLQGIRSGLFDASISADGKRVLAKKYSDKGFEIVEMPKVKLDAKATAIIRSHKNDHQNTASLDLSMPNLSANSKHGPYQPLASMAPTTWTLFGAEREFGVSTQGQDALGVHAYYVGAATEGKSDDAHLVASYTFNDRIGFLVSHDRVLPEDSQVIDYQDELDALLFVRFPYTRLEDQLELRLVSGWNETLVVPKTLKNIRFEDNYLGAGISWSSQKQYLYSSEQVAGGLLRYKIEDRNALPNTRYEGLRQQVDAGWHFQPFDYHGVSIEALYAHADQKAPLYQLGGKVSENFLSVDPFEFDRDKFKLRGFPDDVVSGRDLAFGRFSWQFPNVYIERTLMTVPVGLTKVAPNVFYEYGAVGDFNQSDKWTGRESIGAEATFYTSLGYQFVVPLSVYGAQGLSDNGEFEAGLYFSISFE
jgi:hypothetical protein